MDLPLDRALRSRAIAAAQGKAPLDLLLTGAASWARLVEAELPG